VANLRDVRLRMKAIGQTLQVTKAMNLISTSKLRRGRHLLQDTEPFFNRIQKTMTNVLNSISSVNSMYFKHGDKGHTGIIVVTSDKGLAGGYNANVARYASQLCEKVDNPALVFIGNVGHRYFDNSPYLILEDFSFQGQLPTVEEAQAVSEWVIAQFLWGVFKEVKIVYTHMYSTLKLVPQERMVLPLNRETMQQIKTELSPFSSETQQEKINIEYIPSADVVLDTLAPIYTRGVIYGCLVEAYASEQSARMSAMDEASRNGEDMLAKKQLLYNRVRQTSITQEVTEIVSGSAALMD
jgi:F-type H+-transporting ATPase subunit gamma